MRSWLGPSDDAGDVVAELDPERAEVLDRPTAVVFGPPLSRQSVMDHDRGEGWSIDEPALALAYAR